MNITELDKEILEFIVNGEPWHIICGAFVDRFNQPEELIHKIFNFAKEGLIVISPSNNETPVPTIEVFQRESKKYNWYKDTVCTDGLWYDIDTTDKGFEFVKDRFEEKYNA